MKMDLFENEEIVARIFLTTERSEVVPFFRAVRGREREGSRSDPPPVGAKPPPRSRSDPLLAVGYPSVRGFFGQKLS